MRVRCIRLINSVTGQPETSSTWLTLDREYVILSVLADGTGQVLYRLLSDDGRTPGLFASTQFEVVAASLPSIWCIRVTATGGVELAPPAWLTPGFWESYFNGEKAAQDAFGSATALMTEP